MPKASQQRKHHLEPAALKYKADTISLDASMKDLKLLDMYTTNFQSWDKSKINSSYFLVVIPGQQIKLMSSVTDHEHLVISFSPHKS